MKADKEFYATPWTDTKSSRIRSLNGDWKFNLVSEPSQRPLDFYQVDFDDSSWDKIPVPSNWEMRDMTIPSTPMLSIPTPTLPIYPCPSGFSDDGANYGINP